MACKVDNHNVLIDKIAGIKQQFNIDDVKERVISMLDQLLMKWIAREGKDMFNLQINSFEIGNGIKEDMDFEMRKIGLSIPSFLFPASVIQKKSRECRKRRQDKVWLEM